jgi:hypothetical protein
MEGKRPALVNRHGYIPDIPADDIALYILEQNACHV